MKFLKKSPLFPRLLILTSALGIVPIVIMVLFLILFKDRSLNEFKQILGVLLITMTVTSFCLAAFAAHSIKSSLQKLLMALQRFQVGHFDFRIALEGDKDVVQLYRGFNSMAELVHASYLQKAEREKAKVMTDQALRVVHDMSGPLFSIQTAAQYFEKLPSEAPYFADHCSLLNLASKRLSNISDDLLHNHGRHDVPKETFSLHTLLDELLAEYQHLSHCASVKFSKHYAEHDLPYNGNASKLQRAFGNIIKNALEAMNYSGEIKFSTSCKAQHILVSISDNGPGMSNELQAKILHGGYSEGKSNGHGIGMSVVQEAVRWHGGRLELESAPGQGSRFIFILPLE